MRLRCRGGVGGGWLAAGLLALIGLLLWTEPAQAIKPPMTVKLEMDKDQQGHTRLTGKLTVFYKDRKILIYAFADKQFKPYVQELYTLRGDNVLLDAPSDHPHHHGVMYGVWVNGINFWEEKDSPGIERSFELRYYSVGQNEFGMPKAQFVQTVLWLPPAKHLKAATLADALLVEQRTLTVTVDERSQEVALRWDSEFEVGKKAAKVKLTGNNYDGLGLRLPVVFNHVAKFQNSTGQPFPPGNNTQNVIPAKWTSVSGSLAGHPVMLALFGRPQNPGGDTLFFTMLDPFAYLSATQGLDKKPLEYGQGAKFKLSHLLAVYSDNQSGDFLQQRYSLWLQQP